MAVRRQSSADQATLERMAADTGRATRSSGSKNLRHALGGTAEMATKAAEYKPTRRLFGEGGSGRLSLALQTLVLLDPHPFGAACACGRQSHHAERRAEQRKAGAGQ